MSEELKKEQKLLEQMIEILEELVKLQEEIYLNDLIESRDRLYEVKCLCLGIV